MRTHGNAQKHESGNPVQRALIRAFHDRALDLIRRVQPSCILEVGCGEGYVVREIQRAGIDTRLIGVDLSDEAIRTARRMVQAPAELHVMDARDLVRTHLDVSPDLVLMLEVLEHLPEPEHMLEELTGLTSSHVLLSVPREPLFRGMNLLRLKHVRSLGNDPEHINHWSSRGFERLVARHFEIIATARPFPWTMVLARRR